MLTVLLPLIFSLEQNYEPQPQYINGVLLPLIFSLEQNIQS